MKLALGTVQFGTAYGAFNQVGRTPLDEVAACLREAERAGIDMLDTARAYGESEAVIGALGAPGSFRVVTKIAPLAGGGGAAVRASLSQSMAALRVRALDTVLFHRSADLLDPGGEDTWRSLADAKAEGLVGRIGVSVYAAEEIERLLDAVPLDVVQLPYSLIDQRMRTSGALDRLRRGGVEVHSRSTFLQGFVLAAPADLPASLAAHRPALDAVIAAAAIRDTTPLALALAFVAAEHAIDRIVVGVESARQLADIIAAYAAMPDGGDLADLASNDADLVDPSRWSAAAP